MATPEKYDAIVIGASKAARVFQPHPRPGRVADRAN